MANHRLSLSDFLKALPDPDRASNQLNLISFNIQVGIQTAAYHHYLTRSWQPQRGLDHILVSDGLKINQVAVLDTPISDHLPIAMQIQLPRKIIL